MAKFIELPVLNIEKYYAGESEYSNDMLINTDNIVMVYDWSGENDEDIDGNLVSGVVLSTGRELVVGTYYGNIKQMLENE